MWDGSTATTEAVLMAERITGRRRVLVAHSLHPEYRDVLRTYAKNSGLQVEELPFSKSGTLDEKALGLRFATTLRQWSCSRRTFSGVSKRFLRFQNRAFCGRAAGRCHHGGGIAWCVASLLRMPTSSLWRGRVSDCRPVMAVHLLA